MPDAIADSSVVILLSGLDRLELLRDAHQRILVTPAVVREVTEDGSGQPGSTELQEAIADGWISVQAPKDQALVTTLEHDLDAGESECIALATELRPSVVLLDDLDARRRAKTLGLTTTGVLGILIQARRDGTVESLERELTRLRTDLGFWVSEDLVTRALREVGEKQ